jgi:hypothetical protein
MSTHKQCSVCKHCPARTQEDVEEFPPVELYTGVECRGEWQETPPAACPCKDWPSFDSPVDGVTFHHSLCARFVNKTPVLFTNSAEDVARAAAEFVKALEDSRDAIRSARVWPKDVIIAEAHKRDDLALEKYEALKAALAGSEFGRFLPALKGRVSATGSER